MKWFWTATLIQAAEKDVLRDEGETYGRKLDAAGVAVTSVRYNGMIHDYGLLNWWRMCRKCRQRCGRLQMS